MMLCACAQVRDHRSSLFRAFIAHNERICMKARYDSHIMRTSEALLPFARLQIRAPEGAHLKASERMKKKKYLRENE